MPFIFGCVRILAPFDSDKLSRRYEQQGARLIVIFAAAILHLAAMQLLIHYAVDPGVHCPLGVCPVILEVRHRNQGMESLHSEKVAEFRHRAELEGLIRLESFIHEERQIYSLCKDNTKIRIGRPLC